ncbi:MAG: DNA mismatch repair protein [Geobacteraceae bacterium]|nr:MAG: DNA mismatch repair protein [Geobacteraceae bacterium]
MRSEEDLFTFHLSPFTYKGCKLVRKETLITLEFDKILHAIADFANSDASQQAVLDIVPLQTRQEIEKRFGRVEEIRRLSQVGAPLRLSPFQDISPVMAAVRPEGAVLDPRDMAVFVPVLETMSDIAKQLAYRKDIPLLQELAGGLTGFPGILESLVHSVDREGNILDTASKLLFELRTRKRNLTARIRKKLEEIVREKQTAIFLQDDFITQRAGRWVIPVRMDSKGMIQGVVHDVSNSGETAFMEPLEIIGLANELENLIAEVKVEEIRILREICRWIREEADDIEAQFATLVRLDCLNSIARFADLLRAEAPRITDAPAIRLKEARHPILMLLQREGEGREVVPLDLSLGDDEADAVIRKKPDLNRVMVITGPNAGGKTIAIKTAGLLLIMALAGIPVTAASSSVFPLASELLVDIGDEQSIESSLSTFSGHISRITGILGRADARTVVLLDELGTGTEPLQGAAIACAILKDLQDKGALVCATTHLTDIVGFVHRTEGMVNASMEFDRETLTPRYRLKTGEPGQSHAIEIARRYGLPERIIDFAKGMLGRMDTEFHELLADLQEQSRRHAEALCDVERIERELEEKERLLSERLAAAEREKRETLEKAYSEARDVIQAARRDARAVLEEVKREKRREALKMLEEKERQMEEKLQALRPEPSLAPDEIREGATVFVKSLGYDAQVVSLDRRHERVRVKAGSLEIDVPLVGVAPKKGKAAKAVKTSRKVTEEEAETRLNLVGLRVDEALARIEPLLNHASLAGIGEVRIIHGIGTGALMRGVREFLDGHPLVREFRGGEPFEGGSGVTVVKMR